MKYDYIINRFSLHHLYVSLQKVARTSFMNLELKGIVVEVNRVVVITGAIL